MDDVYATSLKRMQKKLRSLFNESQNQTDAFYRCVARIYTTHPHHRTQHKKSDCDCDSCFTSHKIYSFNNSSVVCNLIYLDKIRINTCSE